MNFMENSSEPGHPMTRESLESFIRSVMPDCLVTPMVLEKEAYKLLHSRKIADFPNHSKFTVSFPDGTSETWVSRKHSFDYRRPFRVEGDEENDEHDMLLFNRHMRRRGWPSRMPRRAFMQRLDSICRRP